MNTVYKKYHTNTHENNLSDPITSYGVINFSITKEFKQYIPFIKNTFEHSISNVNITTMTNIDNNEEFDLLKNQVSESILFLMISRKHSLGFVEFIRGRYDIKNKESINHLFMQMTDNEIYEIFTNNFDILWNSMWKKNAKKTTYNKEYICSKEKYQIILSVYSISIFKPHYSIREWGFPKGRKNHNETNLCCAIRECCEETTLFKSEISILKGIEPLTEIMTGTNLLQYKHIYYLSLLNETRLLDMYNDDLQFTEIDTAGWFKKERALNMIRPYHYEKIKIIEQIVNFITYVIYCAKNNE